MKKYLPLILLAAGVIILIVAFVFVRGRKSQNVEIPKEETALLDLPVNERPLVSLTPSKDGHYLNLKIEKIGFDAFSLDYELLYKVPGGLQQGVPGSVPVQGKNSFEAELLLGSESSGKFRYDEGVEDGTLTLRFRNEEGKLLARFSTEFHLQTATDLLTSLDGIFKYKLSSDSDGYFVTMDTVGVPDGFPKTINSAPYGIFTSQTKAVSGKVDAGFNEIYFWDGKAWQKLEEGNSPGVGIFVAGTSE